MGVDRFLDMVRIAGDATISTIVIRTEKYELV